MTTYYKAIYNADEFREGEIHAFSGELEHYNYLVFYASISTLMENEIWGNSFRLMEVSPLGRIIQECGKFNADGILIQKIYSHEESRELLKAAGLEYNQNGQLTHRKTPEGFEEWQEYDENNNLIHYNSSNGYEEWKEYNKYNRLTHLKRNDGYEFWQEYDKNGNYITTKFPKANTNI